MKGHLRKRGDRSWAIVLELDRDPETGKRRQKWHSVSGTKRDAERELSRILNDRQSGAYSEPSKLTVAEYLERWLESVEGSVAGSAFHRYREIVRRHLVPAFGRVPLAALQPLVIDRYYSKALKSGRLTRKGGGLSAQTVVHHHRVLRTAPTQAVRWRLLVYNPADAVQPPRPKKTDMRVLSSSETAVLLGACKNTPLYMPVLLGVSCGLRRGEILALKWTDVDFDSGKLTIQRSLEQTPEHGLNFKPPKNNRTRTVDAPKILLTALRAHKADQESAAELLGDGYEDKGLIVCRADGSIWRPDCLTPRFRKLTVQVGLQGFQFHDLRHTHASQLLERQVHVKAVCERLGHSSVAFTLERYGHLMPTMQAAAVAAVDDMFAGS
jgi:integrase